MTKKITPESLAELPVMVDTVTKTDDDKAYDRAQDAVYSRRRSLEAALEHHKNNGGMLTVAQILDNSRHFHTYITGETK